METHHYDTILLHSQIYVWINPCLWIHSHFYMTTYRDYLHHYLPTILQLAEEEYVQLPFSRPKNCRYFFTVKYNHGQPSRCTRNRFDWIAGHKWQSLYYNRETSVFYQCQFLCTLFCANLKWDEADIIVVRSGKKGAQKLALIKQTDVRWNWMFENKLKRLENWTVI